MNHLLLLGPLGTSELIVIVLIVLLLFGGKKIPELMRGLGKGVKEFKKEMSNLQDDIKLDDTQKNVAKEEKENKEVKED